MSSTAPSTDSTSASSTPAAAGSAPVTKLKATAPTFNPNAKAFNPSAPTFTPAAAAPNATPAAAAAATAATASSSATPKLSTAAAPFKPLSQKAPAFTPTAPSFVPQAQQQQQPYPPQQMQQQQMRNPPFMQPGMVMGPNGPFYPPMGYQMPNFGYPGVNQFPPQFVNPQQQYAAMQHLILQQAAYQAQQQQHAQLAAAAQQGNNNVQQQQQPPQAQPQQQAQPPQAVAPKSTASPLLASSGQPTGTAAAAATSTAATPAAATPQQAKADVTAAAASTTAAAAAASTTAAPAAAAAKKDTPAPAAAPAKPSFAALAAAVPSQSESKAGDKSASGASAAQSFGVTAVLPRKVVTTKPVAERKRELKKPEDEEADLKEARRAAGSTAAAAAATEEEPTPAVAAKPAVSAPAASASASAPVSSPSGSRKQTMADAESSLASAISEAAPPGGSLQYGRDFLLQFQNLNTTPPENLLSSIEAILKGSESAGAGGDFGRPGTGLRPGSQRPGQLGATGGASKRITSNGVTSLVPAGSGQPMRAGFGDKIGTVQAPRQNQQTGGRQGGQGGNNRQGGGDRRNRVDQPMDIEIKPLEMTENRYKKLTDLPADVELLRGVNAIMNKLTPEKFDILVDKVLELQITTAALLRDVVTVVFEKALAEPNYSPVYAEFCVKLAQKLPSFPADENDKDNTHNFKRLVLNQCQMEFEREGKMEGGGGEVSAEVASMSPEERADHDMRMKRRTLGTIRFIGELYVRQMLAGKIMRGCIVLLLGDTSLPVEENIEALCKLLETIGKMMDNKAIKNSHHEFMNTVFEELEKLAQPPSKADREKTEAGRPVLSSRLRFMIQDTIDLRRQDWVLRMKKEVDAKKISAVHKESNAPAQAQDARGNASSSSSSRPGVLAVGASKFGRKDRYAVTGPASPSPRGASAKPADDEWQTATAKGSKRSQDVRGAATSGMTRANSGNASASSASTGRSAGPPTPSKTFSRGASANEKGEKKEETKRNVFDALHGNDDDEDNDHQGSAARAAKTEETGETATDEGETEGEGQEDEAEDGEESSEPTAQLSRDEQISKLKSLMKEYFLSEQGPSDFAEVKLSIQSLGGKSALSAESVYEGLMLVIDGGKDRPERAGLCKLLPLLIGEFISVKDAEDGFKLVLEQSEDFGPDFPRLIEQVAFVLASLIQEGTLAFSCLKELSKPITSEADQVKFAVLVLQNLKKSKGEAGVDFVDYIKSQGVKWNQIGGESLDADAVKKTLTDKKLDMLVNVL